ncbi:MAG: tRNA lysidine(34) synthetase TilS [Actinomycetota bacterium]|nr:tRNA lysidine(34) synthetase TilS [Actinomycetota bacterium]
MITNGAPLVVLLSGGRDSVCLLHRAVQAGARVTALHVNYGLRPEADEDERFCRALCDRLGVDLVVERAEWRGEGNLQAWAREVRYAAAARLAGEDGDIAAGHTATDQAETILYRLAASPGRRALLGMAPREGRVVRPLLTMTREETAAYNEAHGLEWREDTSNDSPAFARNRVRHGLLEELRAVHPAAEANLLRTAELLRDEAAVLDDVVDTALRGRDTIPLATLAALPRALARLVVRRLAEDATGGFCPRAAARLDDVLALADGSLDLGDGARVVVADGVLRMDRTPPLPSPRRR